jgi:GT2 family glycosyltransferase
VIKGSVHVGFVHPGTVHTDFMTSLLQAFKWSNRLIAFSGSTCPRQYIARNDNIEEFLKGPCEWFLQIDTDMTFNMKAPDALVAAAEESGSKMAGALCFGYLKDDSAVFPGIWMWNEKMKKYELQEDYETNSRFWVDATGAAFLVTHRSVLEEMGAPWHQDFEEHPDTGMRMGHDIAFCHRARKVTGEPILMCADIKIGHVKEFTVTEQTYQAYRRNV